MIPLLPNPFNPEDTEFVLDADAFMAALAPDHPSEGRFLLEQEVARARRNLLSYQKTSREPSVPAESPANGRTDRQTAMHRGFAPDAAGRRLDVAPPAPIRDEDALFYLAGSEPQSIAPELPQERPTRK